MDEISNGRAESNRAGWRRYGAGAALLAGGLVAGGVLASTLTATAAAPSPSPSTKAATPAAPGMPRDDRDQSKSFHPGEKLLTGTTASKVRAAALAKYPGATIQRVETDSDGVYEAHLVTSAGAWVTVEVGKDFTVTGTEAGPGGRGGPGHHGGMRPGDSNSDNGPSSSGTSSSGTSSGGTSSGGTDWFDGGSAAADGGQPA